MTEPPPSPATGELPRSPCRSWCPTLGGRQLWADRLVFRRWRIQQHVWTGRCRLLDPGNRRVAGGSFDRCGAQLDQIKQQRQLPPLSGKAVVALHGLMRSRMSMRGLCNFLESEADYTAIDIGYPSTRRDMGRLAAIVAEVLSHLGGAERIDFVAQSMGNIVLRRFFHECRRTGKPVDPRFGRMVMLGPPNLGTQLGRKIVPLDVTRRLFGPAARQLACHFEQLQETLDTPPIPFGIVAGGGSSGRGRNPLIQGDDDGIVAVAETRLPGAADFRRVPAFHATIMDRPVVRQLTRQFLQHGYFESEATREPI